MEIPGGGHELPDHPYGELGTSLASDAHALLDYLSRPFDESANQGDGWYDFDADGLSTLVELERLVPHIRPDERVSIEDLETFHLALTAMRSALPLTHAERHWLVKEHLGVDAYYVHIQEEIGTRTEEVVSEGQRKQLDGADLLRRWLAWRRESGEYSGQGTLELAREALRGMVELLAPDEPLPESYRALREPH
jgi:hypothetical protein